ncbi:MAG: SGNH/GDSL hydrolase family protein, partial [Planctomycetota bacterium]
VWHHGEDWQTQNRAVHQGKLLAELIPSWRHAFHAPDLRFTVVQLEPHRYAIAFGIDGRMAAELREAQREAAERASAMFVTTIDLPVDPSPAVLAERIAGAIAAGKPAPDRVGPQLVSAETKGENVILSFANTQGGLTAKGGELKGFAIAVSPMRWVWADARIDGDTVVVSSPVVHRPEGVRYAWEDVPARGATLCDAKGNPTNPFRTDAHPLVTGGNVAPDAVVVRFNRRANPMIEDPTLPRVLIIGDSISGHYHERLRLLMEGKANIVGEASFSSHPDPRKSVWASVGPRYYRTDSATKGDDLKNYLAESGPWDIVHFNIGIHMFSKAQPGDEKPYAEKLRQAVQTIRDSGAVCLFANSTGTVADNTIPNSPLYLTNCKAFNTAAEEVMREMNVPVTDIYGLIQPRIKELISGDLIHTNAEADQMMAELIAKRLTETIATLPAKPR